MLCRDVTLVKHAEAGLQVSALWCNSWQCEVCAPRRAWRCAQDMLAGRPTKFLTLTVKSTRSFSKEQRARELLRAFQKWVRQVRAKHGKAHCEYYYVFEDTQKGEPHLHVVGRWPFIPKKEISEFFGREIGAPNTRIDGVQSPKGLAAYLTEYLTKGPTKFGTLKRYGNSRRFRLWQRPGPAREPEWRGYVVQVDRPWSELVAEYVLRGFRSLGDMRRGFVRLERPRPPPEVPEPPHGSPWNYPGDFWCRP